MERDSDVETVMADDEWQRTRRSSSSFDEEELFSSSGSLSSLDEFSDAESDDMDDGAQLVRAAAHGDTAACVRLLQRGTHIDSADSHGWTAVHEAARRGHEETLAQLLAPPAPAAFPDINAAGPGRQTALHVAAQQGNAACVRLLLDHGARAAAADARRLTALDMCADAAVARLLTDRAKAQRLIGARDKAGQTKLHRACCAGDVDAVNALLAQGAEVGVADNAGWTPLHEAALEGHALVVAALLRRGADFAARGFGGDTPLHDACANGHVDVVRRLLAAGADALLPNAKGATPTDMAREAEHSDVLRAIDAQKAGREPIDTQQADSKAKAKDIDIGRKPIDPQQPNSKDTETDSKSKAKAKVIDIGIDIENKDTADAGPSRNANAPKKKDKRVREEAPQVNYHFSSAPRLSRDERKLQVLVGTIERLEKHSTRPRKRPRLQPSPTPQLLYTVQLRSGSFVVDLQVRLLLGMSNDAPNPLFRAYPQLRRQKLTVPQKERLWGPLSMAASGEQAGADAKLASVLGAHDRMQFVGMPLYFVSADEVVNVICRDFPQIGKHLVTVALDLGSPAKVSRPWTGPQPMMPLKYALKLHFAEK